MKKSRLINYTITSPSKIRYCNTKCPFGEVDINARLLTVGSIGCRHCEHYIMRDTDQQKVLCSNPNNKIYPEKQLCTIEASITI